LYSKKGSGCSKYILTVSGVSLTTSLTFRGKKFDFFASGFFFLNKLNIPNRDIFGCKINEATDNTELMPDFSIVKP